jgi:hypothetical protein
VTSELHYSRHALTYAVVCWRRIVILTDSKVGSPVTSALSIAVAAALAFVGYVCYTYADVCSTDAGTLC